MAPSRTIEPQGVPLRTDPRDADRCCRSAGQKKVEASGEDTLRRQRSRRLPQRSQPTIMAFYKRSK